MKTLEKPPVADIQEAIKIHQVKGIEKMLEKAQDEYMYWDKVKYMPLPKEITNKEFWSLLKFRRTSFINARRIKFGKHEFFYSQTIKMQQVLHFFDMNYGGQLGSSDKLSELDKTQYLVSSVMEEAIASSQIEGASTTRKVAKQMLRENRAPKNKSEKMILNNYITIKRIKELISQPIDEHTLLELHRLMTRETLNEPKEEGRFRTNNDIAVFDSDNNEIVHLPPDYNELPKLMSDLYDFFNNDDPSLFIHPILKACIIHFMIGYIHPFTDGNGRTARALFYWYLLKKGYWLTEYLSISGIILKQKIKYARAFLYTEVDENDLTYFINYKLEVLDNAYRSLIGYIKRKTEENRASSKFLKLGNINERQALILQWTEDDPDKIIKVKELESHFGITNQTSRSDLQDLVKKGYLKETKINGKQSVFSKI